MLNVKAENLWENDTRELEQDTGLKMRDPGFYLAPQDWLTSNTQMPNPQIPQERRTLQHHWGPAALQPWMNHLLSLCQGLHGYKMRIIMLADSTSHC